MDDWPEGVEYLDRNTDLISDDDGGFFLKRYKPDYARSETFKTRAAAVKAWMEKKAKWGV
jgi:hypothetical protein